jgi:hypothetical protein
MVTLCYIITACTELAIDQYPANDCHTEGFCLDYPAFHDVGGVAVEIIDDGCLNFEFCGTIENFGQFEECCFKTYLKIEEYEVLLPGGDIFFEQFESWPPAGWTTTIFSGEYDTWNTNSYYARSNYAGGDGMCADCDDDRAYNAGGELISPVFSLVGTNNPTLDFIIAYNDISTYYTSDYYWVDISTDAGMSWSNLYTWNYDVSAYGPGTPFTVDLTPYMWSSQVQVLFGYDSGTSWAWWAEVDDVRVATEEIGQWNEIWSTWYCVDVIEPCEQLEFCFDGTWTPPIPQDECSTVTYRATIETELCDPMDQVPGNDAYSETFDVEFKHDIEVTITSPTPKSADLLFEQIVHTPSDSWSFATSDSGPAYKLYEDVFGVTDTIGQVDAWALCLSNPWAPEDPATMTIDVGFYDAGALPGAELAYFANVPFIFTATGDSYAGFPCYYFEIALPSSVQFPTGDGWVSIQSQSGGQGPGFPWFMWGSSGTGNGQSYQEGYMMTAYDRGIRLWSGGPSVAGYFPCGEMDLCAEICNIGTFDEVDDPSTVCDFEGIVVYYELHMYVQDDPCEDPVDVIVASGMQELELPCGECEEICFTYDFTESGVYAFFVWAETFSDDCDEDNNLAAMGFGIDCCPPISDHVLTPIIPGGCNNWYVEQVTVTIDAFDPLCPDPCLGTASGVKEIVYIINGVETVKTGDSVTFKISDEGVNLVEYYAIDEAGNVEDSMSFEVAIDTVKPTVDLIYEKIEDGTLQVKFTAVAVDSTSGIQKVEFYIGTELKQTLTAPPFTWTITWEDAYKTATFKAVVYDGACNTAEDTVFGGDIPGAKTFMSSSAQSHSQPYSNTVSTQQV